MLQNKQPVLLKIVKNRDEETVTDWKKVRKDNNYTQCEITGWILDQIKNISLKLFQNKKFCYKALMQKSLQREAATQGSLFLHPSPIPRMQSLLSLSAVSSNSYSCIAKYCA